MKFIFRHNKHVGMAEKNCESQDQRSPYLQNNGRHLGFSKRSLQNLTENF